MKIDSEIISIPPYISVTWDQVTLVQTEQDPFTRALVLVLHLKEGKEVKIPGLELSVIERAFEEHRKHLENPKKSIKNEGAKGPQNFLQQLIGLNPEQLSGMPIRFGISGLPGMEGMDAAMQHNAERADTEDLPAEVLEKITNAAKLITGGDTSIFPKPEAHCNCTHCQVARAVHGIEKVDDVVEEPVSEEDLSFRDWDIKQIGEALYKVTHPLDKDESYNVFLGKPVGCTCGQAHCEHIRAVLSS